ncbi:MAG: aspartate/glutamate racemase family protein [Gulosibacter sp.]|uniref:aspartate/glutamate racemase family protein n=1 Tax=Gulosibacter sp. TaxID=2817531 RepID=UPI003F8DFAD4
METKSAARVLFLTPFNFAQERNDHAFDDIIRRQFTGLDGIDVIADHVTRFEADDESYESVQEELVVEATKKAEADGYDSVVVACFYDPAVPAAREAATIPVIAPMQLLGGLAAQLGPKFHVITDIDEAVQPTEDLIAGYGLAGFSTGVTAIRRDGDAILADTRAAAVLADKIIQGVAENGEAQSVIIGCTIVSAAYELHRDEFPDHGVNVLNSNKLSLKGASILSN